MAVVKKTKPKPLLFGFIFVLAVILIAIGVLWIYLASSVEAGNKEEMEVVVESGSTTSQIGSLLKEKGLIRSELLFKIYIRLNHVSSLKADTYIFTKDMDLGKIIEVLEKGSNYNPNLIKLTFKEGLRITDYAKVIGDNTNHTYDEVISVMKDKEYINSLITKYWFLTDSILDPNIYYPLEGYLAPNTYHFDNKDVPINDIIETMLSQMEKELETYKSIIVSDPHYYITMASIVELEGTNTENRKMIVGIFRNRLDSGMNLGSDVTTYYGLQVAMTSDLTGEQFASVNAYNTRSTTMIGKMPIGPICNPGLSSIEASINPTNNDYLFFVADKNGKIYYTKTNREHEAKIAEIKANGDWIW